MRTPRQHDLPAFVLWMQSQGYSPLTVRQYERVAFRWLRSHKEPEGWLRTVQDACRNADGVPTRTAVEYARALTAYKRFKAGDDRAEPVRAPRAVRYASPNPQRSMGAAEETLFRAYVRGADCSPQTKALTLLLLDTGLRKREALTLPLVAVQPPPPCTSLRVMGKGHRPRTVPLAASTAAMLAGHLRTLAPGTALLFPALRGAGVMSDRTLRTLLSSAQADLSLDRLTPHTLRHTRATRLLEAGVPPRIAAAILGHGDPRVAQGYLHPGLAHLHDALTTSLESS